MTLGRNDIVKQLNHIFKPSSVAVIGASNSPGKWGYNMFNRPLVTGFRGALYPVNLREADIQGIPSYSSVLDIPGDVELAVISVPAPAAVEVMGECVEKGVRGAVVITAGFAELGEEGKALQQQLLAVARQGNIRFLGPNCMGLYSAAGRLNLCFQQTPRRGGISFITQSGTFGMFLAESAARKGYGIEKVMSIGNQTDLSAADYLEYLGKDPNTTAIVMYIEGIIEGRRFFNVAREVIREKPIIVYKGGRTAVGARATLSHTASLAGDDAIFEALCKQVGFIRAYEAMHTFEMAEALVSQPLPKGRRVAVISGGGGYCVATADACGSLGLELPELDPDAQAAIQAELAPHAPPPRNPVDLAGGRGSSFTVARIAEKLASLPYIDGIITSAPIGRWGRGDALTATREALDAVEVMAAIPGKYGKPLILSMARANFPGSVTYDVLHGARIPSYDTPEESARAFWALARYAEVRRELEAETDQERASKVVLLH